MAPNSPACSFIHTSMARSRSTAPLNRSNSVLIIAPLSAFEISAYIALHEERKDAVGLRTATGSSANPGTATGISCAPGLLTSSQPSSNAPRRPRPGMGWLHGLAPILTSETFPTTFRYSGAGNSATYSKVQRIPGDLHRQGLDDTR